MDMRGQGTCEGLWVYIRGWGVNLSWRCEGLGV